VTLNHPPILKTSPDVTSKTPGFLALCRTVEKKGRGGRRRRLKGERGGGTLTKEKSPIFGMLQRVGEVVIRMLENAQQVSIGP
jgi:hypothetical protein